MATIGIRNKYIIGGIVNMDKTTNVRGYITINGNLLYSKESFIIGDAVKINPITGYAEKVKKDDCLDAMRYVTQTEKHLLDKAFNFGSKYGGTLKPGTYEVSIDLCNKEEKEKTMKGKSRKALMQEINCLDRHIDALQSRVNYFRRLNDTNTNNLRKMGEGLDSYTTYIHNLKTLLKGYDFC